MRTRMSRSMVIGKATTDVDREKSSKVLGKD